MRPLSAQQLDLLVHHELAQDALPERIALHEAPEGLSRYGEAHPQVGVMLQQSKQRATDPAEEALESLVRGLLRELEMDESDCAHEEPELILSYPPLWHFWQLDPARWRMSLDLCVISASVQPQGPAGLLRREAQCASR